MIGNMFRSQPSVFALFENLKETFKFKLNLDKRLETNGPEEKENFKVL